MILGRIADSERYTAFHPLFSQAFQFLRDTDLHALPDGRHEIVGSQLFALVSTFQGHPRNEAKLEIHRRYIDIQVCLTGTDHVGWRSLATCQCPQAEFNIEGDYQFYTDAPTTWFTLDGDTFAVFYPEDAHAPAIADTQLRKVVLKVAVEP
jgi:YhcH/YjgK/YiaL family protein